jgi:hypothetical protein
MMVQYLFTTNEPLKGGIINCSTQEEKVTILYTVTFLG